MNNPKVKDFRERVKRLAARVDLMKENERLRETLTQVDDLIQTGSLDAARKAIAKAKRKRL